MAAPSCTHVNANGQATFVIGEKFPTCMWKNEGAEAITVYMNKAVSIYSLVLVAVCGNWSFLGARMHQDFTLEEFSASRCPCAWGLNRWPSTHRHLVKESGISQMIHINWQLTSPSDLNACFPFDNFVKEVCNEIWVLIGRMLVTCLCLALAVTWIKYTAHENKL